MKIFLKTDIFFFYEGLENSIVLLTNDSPFDDEKVVLVIVAEGIIVERFQPTVSNKVVIRDISQIGTND